MKNRRATYLKENVKHGGQTQLPKKPNPKCIQKSQGKKHNPNAIIDLLRKKGWNIVTE